MTRKPRFQYPVFLDLSQRSVIVIGGGAVAERKVASLLKAGAFVTLVSPSLSPVLADLFRKGEINHVPRPYQEGDLRQAGLVFAATNKSEVNKAVAREGREIGVWVNVADQSVPGDFIVPASFSEKGLIISASSQGRSPALAVKVRDKIKRFLLLNPLDEHTLDK